ncbi:tyrosine-type recombinase/integrase [Limnoglobus roseus]|uniref:Site-specific tyrosine recombinase XerD n=1 Tax=Limnoglobus roseus TaxID=2598579 RepID=A0A5C1AEM6_9BACT|nr:site-specific tyrosine recombinase XerD [Limnoglobus roseus]
MHSTQTTDAGIVPVATTAMVVSRQADSDHHLIDLWLHGRSRHTQRAYRKDAERFLEAVGKPLRAVTLGDLQDHASRLAESGLQPPSVHRRMSAVKSLFAFGHRLGYLHFDVARPLRLPALRDGLADRILEETDVLRMIALEAMPRNKAILQALYAGGFRVAELCSLKWSDLQGRDEGGQITVFGKGAKTRTVLMPTTVWTHLQNLRGGARESDPVFRSRKGGHLDESQVWRIVRRAARRAGIGKAVSCHWLRHAHASHALDRGAPIHLVQACLGHASIATTGKYLHARPSDSSGRYLPL